MFDAIKDSASRRMDKSIQVLQQELSSLRTGRANIALVEHLRIDAMGTKMALNQMASLTIEGGAVIMINVWDANAVQAVVKGITDSDIGLMPQVNGTVLRLKVPPLTEDRRRDIAKLIGNYGEAARVSVRNIRRDAIQSLKEGLKAKDLTQDEERSGAAQISSKTQQYIDEVDKLLALKEKEVMTI